MYLLRTKNIRWNRNRTALWFIGAIVFVGIFLNIFAPKFMGGVVYGLGKIIWGARTSINNFFSDTVLGIEPRISLEAENRLLREEIAGLRMFGDFSSLKDDTRASVSVLKKPPLSGFDAFVLQGGENMGIYEGDLVVRQNILLGKIVAVYGNISIASFFSSPESVFPVMVGPNRIQTEARGRGGGNFTIRLPKDVKVIEGDLVIFPDIPKLAVGKVEIIETDPLSSFQSIFWRTPINIYELSVVEVIKNFLNPSER